MDAGLLDVLPATERQAVRSLMVRRTYRRDEVLFHEGDPGDQLLVIEKGRVAIRITTSLGDVATVTILGRGDVFGEQALLDGDSRRTATAVALEPVEVRALHRDRFADLRQRYPSVDRMLVELLAGQVRRLSGSLVEALYLPVERRVLRRLAELTDLYDEGEFPVIIPLRQDDVASLVGTTRPTVNRVLQSLVEDGLLRLSRGRIEVCDPGGLGRRAA